MNPALRLLSGGVLVGALAWMLFGGSAPALDAPPKAVHRGAPANISVADALGMPIFTADAPGAPVSAALPPAPGADAGGDLKLIGVMLTPRRRAALISLGGARGVWITEGQTANGLTVSRLSRNGAEVQDAAGLHRLKLFQGGGGPVIQPGPASQPPAAAPIQPAPPAGLPPASAPPTAAPSASAPKGHI